MRIDTNILGSAGVGVSGWAAAVSVSAGSSVRSVARGNSVVVRQDATVVIRRPKSRVGRSRFCMGPASYGICQSLPRMTRTSKSPAGLVAVLTFSGGMFISRTRNCTVPGCEP